MGSIDDVTLILAKNYVDESLIGGGAVKGKNCVIQKIESDEEKSVITFSWTLDDGTVKTDSITVMNGVDGIDGKDGIDGEKGDKGDKGDKGADGASAYEIAVEAGFSGTEAEWLESLKGKDGKDGEGAKISKEEGNALTEKPDGLFVPKSSSGGTDAESVSYENTSYPTWNNVKKAIDGILSKIDYVKPSITSFTATPSTTVYEIGQKVTSLVFKWTTNKDITSQTLTGCTLADETVRTATYDTEISANKTFTLSISDGQNTDSKNFSVAFQNKVYYGSKALQDIFDSAFVLGLSTNKFSTTKAGTYNVNVATDEYAFIAYPKSFGQITSAKIGGFDTDLENCGDISFTNASGYTSTYNIVRTKRSGLGSISMIVS